MAEGVKILKPNPYVTGPPISGDRGFYGRRPLLAQIERDLSEQGQNVVLLPAQRRIGKTTVLHQLIHFLPSERFQPIYFDIQGNVGSDLVEVQQRLAQQIANKVGLRCPANEAFQDDGFFQAGFLKTVRAEISPRQLVLLVDEFDNLAEPQRTVQSSSQSLALVSFLSDLVKAEADIAWVFVVGRRVDQLPVQYRSILGRAVPHPLERFSREISDQLLSQTAKDDLSYSDKALERAFELASGHPYLTQQIGFLLFQRLVTQDRHTADVDDVDDVAGNVLERASSALKGMLQAPPAEKIILSAVAEISVSRAWVDTSSIFQALGPHRIRPIPEELEAAPRALVDWDLLERTGITSGGAAYRFAVELLRRWTAEERPLWLTVQEERDCISSRAVESYQQAKQERLDGQLSRSEELYRTAIRENPVHLRAHLELAAVLRERSRWREALDVLKRAAEIDPDVAQDVLSQLEAEVEVEINDALARARHAIAVGHLGDAQQVVDVVRGLAPLDSRVQALDTELAVGAAEVAARKALTDGDYAAAVREAQRGLDLAPSNQTMRAVLDDAKRSLAGSRLLQEAEAAYRQGDLSRAEDLVNQVASLTSLDKSGKQLLDRIREAKAQARLLRRTLLIVASVALAVVLVVIIALNRQYIPGFGTPPIPTGIVAQTAVPSPLGSPTPVATAPSKLQPTVTPPVVATPT